MHRRAVVMGALRTAALSVALAPAMAAETVPICYNYGCLSVAPAVYDEARLARIRDLLDDATDAAQERALLAIAIGRLLGWAGEQTPIAADRGGNYADEGVHGKMDCIDHATTTTRLLQLLERRRWLRWHRVLEPEVRTRLVIFDHWTAVVEEVPRLPFRRSRRAPEEQNLAPRRYAVDSWFNDNGEPAVIQLLDAWMEWEGPRVE